MKILVICQHYYPEPFRITDVCEELVKNGHEVTVVTGTPNYPLGKVYAGYENGLRADEIVNGVKVHRCKTAPRKTGVINRVINYYSYARVSKRYVKKLPDEFDVVFVNQLSPVMMANAGITYKKKYGKKLVLYCMDLWPESLCVGGIKKGSLVYKIFSKVSKKIYRSADSLLITSRLFEDYLIDNFGIEKDKIKYLPQYAEEGFLSVKPKEPDKDFHLLFAGNIGMAQSVDTIIESARILKDENVIFDIVGDGVELENLRELAKDLPKVIFHGRKPLSDMPKYYENADAMLVTLIGEGFVSRTLPGKVQTYMAAGRTIIGAIEGETEIVLNDAQGGYCGKSGDSQALAKNILKLIKSGEAKELGASNREYYLKNFSKKSFIKELNNALK